MIPTRFACGVSLSSLFREDIFNSLLWVDKLIFPSVMIYGAFPDYGLESSIWQLIESSLIVTDSHIRDQGWLKTEDRVRFRDIVNEDSVLEGDATFRDPDDNLSALSVREFSNHLFSGGITAPSVYSVGSGFNNDYRAGTNLCLSVVLKNVPKIDFKATSFDMFLDFVKDEQTANYRRRLFDWMNQIDKKALTPREIQEQLATQLDDYKTWIDTAKLKHMNSTFESVIILVAEMIENCMRLKPSKAVKALFEFRKRELDLITAELQAPGRHLAYIHRLEETFIE